MAPRVILFAGAPPPSAVDATSCTIHHFEKPFRQFMGVPESPNHKHHSHHASFAAPHATWRSLSLVRQPLHTGFSQDHQFHATPLEPNTGFFTTADVTSRGDLTRSFEDAEDLLTQFCEQSLAVHNPAPSSQLDADSTAFDESTTSINDSTSFMATSSPSHNRSSAAPPQPAIPCAHLSDLEDIPPARRVLALVPQTVTVNLIAGVISIAQPRSVTTRWGRALSLVEVLVGDETRSGFGVTFWLSSGSVPGSQLGRLRRQDVVLLRNVALHVFRDGVYGQSLRGGLTQISLLWRRDGGGHYSTRALGRGNRGRAAPAAHPQLEKTRRVKDWVLNFVGGDRRSTRRAPRKSWDQPPDDTQ